MKAQFLFKIHDDGDCDKLQIVTIYLIAMNIADIRPDNIIERLVPENITLLPSMFIEQNLVSGLPNIIAYYEKLLNESDLINRAERFAQKNPNYRINQKYTHREISF